MCKECWEARPALRVDQTKGENNRKCCQKGTSGREHGQGLVNNNDSAFYSMG